MEVLEAVFKHEGIRTATISIDDFYLRFEDQQALAQVISSTDACTCSDLTETVSWGSCSEASACNSVYCIN